MMDTTPRRRELLKAAVVLGLVPPPHGRSGGSKMTDVGTPLTSLQASTIGGFNQSSNASDNAPRNGIVDFSSTDGTVTPGYDGTSVITDGNTGVWSASGFIPRPTAMDAGVVIYQTAWELNTSLDEFDARAEIGAMGRSPSGGELSNNAAFRPDVGQNTQGNIEVTSAGTVNQGTIDYSPIADRFVDVAVYTSVVIDFDSGVTEFYFSQNPYVDTPEGTINAVPDTLPPAGVYVHGTGGGFQRAVNYRYLKALYIL